MSLTFQPSKKYQSPPPKSTLYLTSSRSSLLRGSLCSKDFSFKPSSSSNRSPLISTDNYTTLFFSTFITCNATMLKKLWTVVNFPVCSFNKPAPVITVVTINRHVQIMRLRGSHPYQSASMPIAQSSINRPLSPIKGDSDS